MPAAIISERGLTSTAAVRYTVSLMERLHSSTVPTCDTAATATVVDGFTTEQTDHTGGSYGYTRQYLSTGVLSTQTDTRGITASRQTDVAARPIIRTDGAGNHSTISYTPCCDQPASTTDGIGIQPATYAYDDADRMTMLTTYRVNDSSISNPLQWSSEIADTELALVYYNYRHYNSTDGRWINRDPISEEGGLNFYGFVGNMGWTTDVLGMRIFCCLDGYASAHEAAIAAKEKWNPVTKVERTEYGGYICGCAPYLGSGTRTYYYTVTKGEETSVNVHKVKCSIYDTTVMIWDTHPFVPDKDGKNIYDAENFSLPDKSQRYPIYVFTPQNKVKIYYPSSRTEYTIIEN